MQTSVSIGVDVALLRDTFKLNIGSPRVFFSDCLMWKPEGIMLFCSTQRNQEKGGGQSPTAAILLFSLKNLAKQQARHS